MTVFGSNTFNFLLLFPCPLVRTTDETNKITHGVYILMIITEEFHVHFLQYLDQLSALEQNHCLVRLHRL